MIGVSVSHYRIVRKLGKGGQGQVYLADDLHLDRQVALKFLNVEFIDEPHLLERFHREAKAAAALSHPNIITVHEVGLNGDQPYIAMAYVDGQSLTHVIEGKRMPVSRAIKIACQVCDALAEAHQHGIVHRDIQPDNIHLDRHDRVRILDFGLALRRGLTQLTPQESTVGTISYMSPEQTTGHLLDHRTDIFSFGAVLYEMLTGHRPFNGPNAGSVVKAIQYDKPRPVRELNPRVGDTLARIVETALQKDPADRYPNAHEMGRALRTARSATERLQRTKDRRRRLVIGALIAAAAIPLFFLLNSGGGRKIENSLAVLPLDNLSGDASQDFFAEGMTEALITRLAQIEALRVISRTSVMQYRDTAKPTAQIARELGVSVIVEGAVIRTGDKLRVTAQIIDARTDDHLWAGTFSSDEPGDIIELQSQIATEIAQQVSVHMTSAERSRLGAYRPADPEAYEAFLQGRYHLNRRTPQDLALAADHFNRAIERDSTFAQAYAGIADCYAVSAMWNWDTSHNTFPRARYACRTALRIDPDLADANASLAIIQLYYDWDWTAAEKSFKKAIELNPNYAIAYHWYGLALMTLGHYEDAIKRHKQACNLDPLSPIMLVTLSQAYDMNGDYELANESLDRAFELFPSFGYAWLARSWVQYHQGRYAEAVESSRKAMSFKVDRAEVMLVASLVKLGDTQAAAQALQEALARETAPFHVRAALYAYYGDMPHAFEMAERAIDEREWFVVAFRSRWMEPLRDDPKFEELLKERAPIK